MSSLSKFKKIEIKKPTMRLTKGLGFGGANILPGPGIYHAYHLRFPKDTGEEGLLAEHDSTCKGIVG